MDYQAFLNMPSGNLGSWELSLPLILALAVWELAWKGWALWKAARNNESAWYVALLILNTIGILPILYIFLFAKDRKK